MEAKAPVGRLYGLENLRMTVAERVGRPTILEIDVAITIQVPDEVALRLIDNDLPRTGRNPRCPARSISASNRNPFLKSGMPRSSAARVLGPGKLLSTMCSLEDIAVTV